MSNAASGFTTFKSSPLRALKAPISSPNWLMNLVWLTVAALLNSVFIGQIALLGYGSEALRARAGRPENCLPDIDSDRFGDYITQGIWPFVIAMIAQIVLGVLALIPMGLMVAVGFALANLGGDAGVAIAAVIATPIVFLVVISLGVFSAPFIIRAMICQDLQTAFKMDWAINFVKLMFWEIFVSSLVYALLSFGVLILGMAALCVGYLPAIGLVSGGWLHLLCQWYEIYLSLGGEPAPEPVLGPAADGIVDAKVI